MSEGATETVESAAAHLRSALEQGQDWPTALIEAMAQWTVPQESYKGRTFSYFIAGEAFDWLVLAERLYLSVDGLVPKDEAEELLFLGRFPSSFESSRFKGLLGVDKYRGYLNYFYGVTVEEALQVTAELEVQKRYASNGVRYRDDFTDEAFERIYGATRTELLGTFRGEKGYRDIEYLTLTESKEFTYWLFQHRMRVSDKARIASDTRKGLEQLRGMREACRAMALSRAI